MCYAASRSSRSTWRLPIVAGARGASSWMRDARPARFPRSRHLRTPRPAKFTHSIFTPRDAEAPYAAFQQFVKAPRRATLALLDDAREWGRHSCLNDYGLRRHSRTQCRPLQHFQARSTDGCCRRRITRRRFAGVARDAQIAPQCLGIEPELGAMRFFGRPSPRNRRTLSDFDHRDLAIPPRLLVRTAARNRRPLSRGQNGAHIMSRSYDGGLTWTPRYALGLILYEVFTGRRLFDGRSVEEIRSQHRTAKPPSISTAVREIDPEIERVIVRCLEEDPASRPSSAHAVIASLPGRDPLAAAVAPGETPSPGMVAAAGQTGDVQPALAWPQTSHILCRRHSVTTCCEKYLRVQADAGGLLPSPQTSSHSSWATVYCWKVDILVQGTAGPALCSVLSPRRNGPRPLIPAARAARARCGMAASSRCPRARRCGSARRTGRPY